MFQLSSCSWDFWILPVPTSSSQRLRNRLWGQRCYPTWVSCLFRNSKPLQPMEMACLFWSIGFRVLDDINVGLHVRTTLGPRLLHLGIAQQLVQGLFAVILSLQDQQRTCKKRICLESPNQISCFLLLFLGFSWYSTWNIKSWYDSGLALGYESKSQFQSTTIKTQQ